MPQRSLLAQVKLFGEVSNKVNSGAHTNVLWLAVMGDNILPANESEERFAYEDVAVNDDYNDDSLEDIDNNAPLKQDEAADEHSNKRKITSIKNQQWRETRSENKRFRREDKLRENVASAQLNVSLRSSRRPVQGNKSKVTTNQFILNLIQHGASRSLSLMQPSPSTHSTSASLMPKSTTRNEDPSQSSRQGPRRMLPSNYNIENTVLSNETENKEEKNLTQIDEQSKVNSNSELNGKDLNAQIALLKSDVPNMIQPQNKPLDPRLALKQQHRQVSKCAEVMLGKEKDDKANTLNERKENSAEGNNAMKIAASKMTFRLGAGGKIIKNETV